jgi:uncharacterized membrane protein YgcG
MRPLYLRKITVAVAVLFGLIGAPLASAQIQVTNMSEAIRSFHSDIEIQENGSLRITETIEFFTPTPRHGIYRQIPYRYNRDGWRFTTRVRDIDVTADEESVDVEQSSDRAFLTLKIGDPDTTFTGPRTFTLTYTVDHAIQASLSDPNTPELYWDITGESWQIPILETSASITSPNTLTSAECFSGAYGQNNQLCQIDQQGKTASLSYDERIEYGDNVTVRLGLDPNGIIHAPTAQQKRMWWLTDHWSLFLLALTPIAMTWAYIKRGRDWWYSGNLHLPNVTGAQLQRWPWNQPAPPMVYEPPDDLTPGEASVLLYERVVPTALVAEILDLTHLGHMKVERRDNKKYWFIKKNPSGRATIHSKAQQLLLDGLFNGASEVSLDSLKGTFYSTAEKVREQLQKQLVDRKLVSAKPGLVRGSWLAIGLTVAGLVAGLAMMILDPFIPLVFWPLAGLSGVITFACAWAMPRRTAAGSNAAWRMKGLQRTIARGAWREKIKEKNLFIEEVLPFAVALGVVKQLARDLKDLNIEPPEYAQALMHNGALSNALLSNFSQSTASSFAPPSSSSSGWSGGGGSSGGGGGGGGGGSW